MQGKPALASHTLAALVFMSLFFAAPRVRSAQAQQALSSSAQQSAQAQASQTPASTQQAVVPPDADKPLRVGGNVMSAKLVQSVPPRYPDAARLAPSQDPWFCMRSWRKTAA